MGKGIYPQKLTVLQINTGSLVASYVRYNVSKAMPPTTERAYFNACALRLVAAHALLQAKWEGLIPFSRCCAVANCIVTDWSKNLKSADVLVHIVKRRS